MKIKSFTYAAIAAALLLAGSLPAAAQTIATNQVPNQLPPTPANIFNSFGNYFTSNDTNFNMHSTAEISFAASYQSGVNFANDFGIRYKYDLTANTGILGESVTRNAGIAGVIVSEQVGVGLYYINYGIEISGGVDAGYRFDAGSPALTLYLDVRKSLTPNTYAGLRLAYETDFSTATPSAPVIGAITGFKF